MIRLKHALIAIALFSFSHVNAQSPDTLWTDLYFTGSNEKMTVIKELDDGGYILGGSAIPAGQHDKDFFAVRLNEDGEFLWQATIGEVLWDEWCYDITILADGSYLLFGDSKSQATDDSNYYIANIDSSGELIY